MALYSNWNVLTLPIKADGKYKIGDTYQRNWWTQSNNG